MIERLTDRARRVMDLAHQEARRLRHGHLGTEHLLLGLAREGSGLGACVLQNLGVDLEAVAASVERSLQAGSTETPDPIPLTPEATRVLDLALEEATAFRDRHVGTEHLLLGLICEGHSAAAEALRRAKVGVEDVRDEVLFLRAGGARAATADADPPASFARPLADLEAALRDTDPGTERAAAIRTKLALVESLRDQVGGRSRLVASVSETTELLRRAERNLDGLRRALVGQAVARTRPGFPALEALVAFLRDDPGGLARVLADVKVSEADFLAAVEREIRRREAEPERGGPAGGPPPGPAEPPNPRLAGRRGSSK